MNKSTLSYKSNLLTEYPAQRICTIDYYPVIKDAIDETFNTCNQLGINNSQWTRYSKDLTKLFLHHCLEKLCTVYTESKSIYTKVYVVYPTAKKSYLDSFLYNHLDKILNVCPMPWCKVKSLNDPEIEFAALRAINSKKTDYSKLLKFTKNYSLHVFKNKIQKKRIFLNSIVDFSRQHD